ncbi:MAG: hypothetical protein JEZ04_18445 [Spirochaetales bacterium]|nr:hypothetical protein [Spirochaetales bacterium]
MKFYFNLALTYVVIGMLFSFLFYFFFKKKSLNSYFFCLLTGVIGSFFGGLLDVFVAFDPLKFITFFERVFTIGVFWPSVGSVALLFFYSKSVENN